MTTEDIRAELQQNIDEKYRAFHASLVPGIGTFLGVRVPKMRELGSLRLLLCNVQIYEKRSGRMACVFKKVFIE